MTAQVRGEPFEKLRISLLKRLPGLSSIYNSIQYRNYEFIRLALKLQQGNIFLDGSKDPQRLLYFLASKNYDISVICMTRDGRAQSFSQLHKNDFPHSYTSTYVKTLRIP